MSQIRGQYYISNALDFNKIIREPGEMNPHVPEFPLAAPEMAAIRQKAETIYENRSLKLKS